MLWRRRYSGLPLNHHALLRQDLSPGKGRTLPSAWPRVPSGDDSRAVLWHGCRHRAGRGGRPAKRPGQPSCVARGTANLFLLRSEPVWTRGGKPFLSQSNLRVVRTRRFLARSQPWYRVCRKREPCCGSTRVVETNNRRGMPAHTAPATRKTSDNL